MTPRAARRGSRLAAGALCGGVPRLRLLALLAVLTPALLHVGHASAPLQLHPPAGTPGAVAPAQSTRFSTGCPRWHRKHRSQGSPAPPGTAARSGPRPDARATRYTPRPRASGHPWRGPSRSGGAVTTPDGSPSNNCPTLPQRPWPCRISHPAGWDRSHRGGNSPAAHPGSGPR
jgi:hypothetical protein